MKNYIIDIGCGNNPKSDATHTVDISGDCSVRHDLNILPYPFPDRCAIKIYSDNVCEHLGINIYGFLRECHRILQPGGVLVLRMPNPYFMKKRICFLFFGTLPSYAPDHISYVKPSLLKAVLIHLGYRVHGNFSDSWSHEVNVMATKRPIGKKAGT